MALQWFDGGEVWGVAGYQLRGYQSGSTTFGAPRIEPGLRSLVTQGSILATPALPAGNTWFGGCGLRIDSSSQIWQWRILNAGLEQCRLETVDNLDNTFEIRVMRGVTQLGITAQNYQEGIWHFIEFNIVVRTGTNGSAEIRQNQTAHLTLTLQNTADQAVDGADAFTYGHAPAGVAVLMDDIYILDDTTAVNNSYLGDVVMFELVPELEGNQNDFTPSAGVDNSDLIDDLSTVVTEADWVSSDTNAHQDFYTYSDLPATGIGSIFGLRVAIDAAMETVGSRTLKPKFRAASTVEGDGDDFVVDGTAVVGHTIILNQDPVAAGPWTKTEIDAGEFGVEVVS